MTEVPLLSNSAVNEEMAKLMMAPVAIALSMVEMQLRMTELFFGNLMHLKVPWET